MFLAVNMINSAHRCQYSAWVEVSDDKRFQHSCLQTLHNKRVLEFEKIDYLEGQYVR